MGDLVRIKQGSRYGKLALISEIDRGGNLVYVVRGSSGDRLGYYRRDLEVLSASR